MTGNQYVRETAQYLAAGGTVHKGKHSDLWQRINHHIRKLRHATWVKAHESFGSRIWFEDWFGNNEADIQAKKGAEQHGYSTSLKNIVLGSVDLTRRVQHHRIIAYQRSISQKYVVANRKIKGTPTGQT
eukprot:16409132-Heterocapsa_arctica.AAC.1